MNQEALFVTLTTDNEGEMGKKKHESTVTLWLIRLTISWLAALIYI